MNPRISIITVVFNGEKVLERTIQSIHTQTYRNLEYIIIDGASNDGTLELIKQHQEVVNKWKSEPDRGLYDAMNKGLAMASGDYVLFLNAGDQFYKDQTLEKVFSDGVKADVLYGETLIVDPEGKEIGMRRLKTPEVLSWKSLMNGMLVCHQSFIVRRSISPQYELRYKIAADYAWMLECLKRAKTIVNTHMIISRFLEGGMNKSNIPTALKERFYIMASHYGWLRTLIMHVLIGLRFIWFVIKNRRF
jgi:glycosyltransferase involved in cell wall biosynthesis